uniref:Uncharacterized protein n=1 Tax=Romanomermis culicivorax TaxID=13658 RepID=A0A915K9E8_ROMCU
MASFAHRHKEVTDAELASVPKSPAPKWRRRTTSLSPWYFLCLTHSVRDQLCLKFSFSGFISCNFLSGSMEGNYDYDEVSQLFYV